MIRTQRFAILGALFAGLIGCAPEASESADPGEVSSAELPPPVEQAALSDPQIAHIAVTANTIDVETARLVESRTETPEVRAFAETMITDHTAVNEQASELVQRLGVTPEENDVSQSLQADAEAARAGLEGLNGEAFDRAYIDREVGYHQAVLDALDDTLIPNATNAELRALLEQVRPAIVAHLEHARSLQASGLASR